MSNEKRVTLPPHGTFMGRGDVARELSVSNALVSQWEAAGKIAATRTVGGVSLFLSADVAAIARARAAAKKVAKKAAKPADQAAKPAAE